MAAGNICHDSLCFGRGLMGQHHAPDQIPDGVHTGQAGFKFRIDLYKGPLGFNAEGFAVDTA